jgi:hypothetical protein
VRRPVVEVLALSVSILLLAVMFTNIVRVIAYFNTETFGFDTLDQQSLTRGNDTTLEVTYPITASDLVLIPVVAPESRRLVFNVGGTRFDYQTTEQIIRQQDNANSVFALVGASGRYRLRFYQDSGVLRAYFERE